jgi:peptidyl-prolyl cis-trans isomerase D
MSKARSGPSALTRKQHSRAARDRRMRLYVLIGTVAVAVIVLGIIGYGLLDQTVLQPRQPVARVGGVQITTADFQKAVRFQRYQIVNRYQQTLQTAQIFGSDPQAQQYFTNQLQQLAAQLQDPRNVGQQVLTNLTDDQLIRQEAARRGLTVTKDEVDARLRQEFGYFPNGTPTPTITPSPIPTDVPPTIDPTRLAQWTPTPTLTPTATLTPTETSTPGPSPTPEPTGTPLPTATPYTAEGYATVAAGYTGALLKQGSYGEADFRTFVESILYREKLTAAIGADVPATEEQVWARHILIGVSSTVTDTEKTAAKAKAEEVLAKLKAGEDWTALAAQYSTDTSNAQQGGDLHWFGKGAMVAEFEAVAFSLPVGQISDVVATQFGYHIIQVLGHENRPLTNDQIDQKRQKVFDDWLQKQRAATDASGKPLVETFARWQDQIPILPALPTP